MSHNATQEVLNTTVESADHAEILEVIREEQCSPSLSSASMDGTSKIIAEEEEQDITCKNCSCKKEESEIKNKIDPEVVEMLLKEKQMQMQEEFEKQLEKEISHLKDRFDFVLQNEQIRSSYMLREAHRERQEKVTALQTQLECKNLAGLMYVMCSERRKSKLEKLRLIEEYSNYIYTLQNILSDAQSLILHLSRGYKTAARVDYEWRDKMVKVVKEVDYKPYNSFGMGRNLFFPGQLIPFRGGGAAESSQYSFQFQAFVYHFTGGTPESNQYFFDLPALLKTNASLVDSPEEDPCDELEEEEVNEEAENEENKSWWDRLDGDARPFVMFGDMAEFRPPQRREVLKNVKASKTAPKKWKEYVFNEMFLKAKCPNSDSIKDEYPQHLPAPSRWECHAMQTQDRQSSKLSIASRPYTRQSTDVRGDMGSILKIITTLPSQPPTKTTLLAARDSMEIASTTKLREKHKHSDHSKVTLNIGNRRTSMFEDFAEFEGEEFEGDFIPEVSVNPLKNEEEKDIESHAALGSVHNDSLQVINTHVPDRDHKINYEKVCPMDECQRMQVDSFVKSLPSYMRANPFTHFEQTFEEYETCTAEQLHILKSRIEEKKKREKHELEVTDENPLNEWTPSVDGVAIQTSAMSMSLPPCTCMVPSPTPVSSVGRIFNVEDLIPMKQAIDRINQQCFYDSRIEFDRFKVIGQESNNSMITENKHDFKNNRVQEIKKILRKHPSLLDIFQANTQC